jgi:hypothetical protein
VSISSDRPVGAPVIRPAEIDVPAGPEAQVLSLLASGRVADALTLLDGADVPPAFAVLARADARVRTWSVPSHELHGLVATLARRPGTDPALRWWASALVAERLALELDPGAVTAADRALAAIPTDDLLPITALAARARLRRAAATRLLFHPAPGAAEASRADQCAAVTDFLRCGHVGEALVTEAVEAAGRIGFFGVVERDRIEHILDIRSLLDDPASLWPALVDHLLCILGALVDEPDVAAGARDRLATGPDHSADLGPWPALAEMAGLLSGELDDEGLAAFDGAARRFDRRFVRHLWGMMLIAAHRLADGGHPEALRRARSALNLATLGMTERGDLDLHRHRFAIAGGTAPPVGEMVEDIRRLSDHGRPDSADRFASLLADELTARAAPEDAAALRAWNRAGPVPVAPVPEPVPDPDPDPAAVAAVRIGVLSPTLEVTAGGRPVRLGQAAALLIVHLAVAGGTLHVEQVGDLLWPEAPIPVVRQRLNSLLHRIRRQHPAVSALVGRTDDVVLLDRSRSDVDLWALDGPGTEPEALPALLASVRGNLCHVQFPYDERLVDARHQLAARWARRAGEVLAQDPGARPRLVAAATALELDAGTLGAV